MTPPREPAHSDRYEMWDAAYVLGSLSSDERREYEVHLSTCRDCRAAVAALSGMPALLALLDRGEVAATPELPPEPPPLRPEVLDTLLEKVQWRRRRSRWVSWTSVAAAAVVLAVAVLVATRPGALDVDSEPHSTLTAMTMSPIAASELSAEFTVASHGWGTSFDMTCTYRDEYGSGEDGDEGDGDRLAMIAVGRDGTHVELATWMARAGSTARTSGSTAVPIDEIASVLVVSADSGNVLLQRDL